MALSADKKAELEIELTSLNTAINAAYNSQSYSTVGGNSVTRQPLDVLLKRRTKIERMLGKSGKTSTRAREMI